MSRAQWLGIPTFKPVFYTATPPMKHDQRRTTAFGFVVDPYFVVLDVWHGATPVGLGACPVPSV